MTSALVAYDKARLLSFEERIKTAFLAKEIHAPVHLSGGNEEQVLDIFKQVHDQDWVFSTWRSHYHALLKGIPEEQLYQDILDGRSMFINSKEHKFLASSIVGGVLPIALGVAMGAKRLGLDERIWVFIGDMAARTGITHEFMDYARGHELAISVVVEDNGLSTNTPTMEVWGRGHRGPHHHYYKYERSVPHVGVGQWVTFG